MPITCFSLFQSRNCFQNRFNYNFLPFHHLKNFQHRLLLHLKLDHRYLQDMKEFYPQKRNINCLGFKFVVLNREMFESIHQ